jgi:hypothetical protein
VLSFFQTNSYVGITHYVINSEEVCDEAFDPQLDQAHYLKIPLLRKTIWPYSSKEK